MKFGKECVLDIISDTVVFLGVMQFATFLILAYCPIDSAVLILFLQLLMLGAFISKMYEKMKFENYIKIFVLSLISSLILLIITFECLAFSL